MLTVKRKSSMHGFTMVEILIVLVIVSILAMVAYPAYQDSIRKARRSDARAAALDLAALQEKWYFQNNSFTDDITKLDPDSLSHEGHYTVDVDDPCGDLTCFTIEVEPTGDQADDTECALFTVTHTGRKEAENSGGDDTTDRCWGN